MARRIPSRAQAGSIGFLLAYSIPGTLIASIWLGRSTQHLDAIVFVPLLLGVVVLPIIQWWWPYILVSIPEAMRVSPGWRTFHRLLPLLALPAQLAMLSVASDAWVGDGLGTIGRLVLLLTTGILSAMFAITIAHDLIHGATRFERALGGILLSTVGFGTFKIVHLRVHHRHVGTARDFATARRGQTIYGFWRQCFIGNFREALRLERSRAAQSGRGLWRSELATWSAFSALWLVLACALWGWQGGVFFVLQSVLAVMELDCINYLQHYGLVRRLDAGGRPEPVRPQHSWTQSKFLHDLVLLNLLRHADHHVHPDRPYQLLEDCRDAPRYPYNYAIMNLLLLVPAAFRHVVHPCLDRIAAEQAKDIEAPAARRNADVEASVVDFVR